jgi:hypothetical protein
MAAAAEHSRNFLKHEIGTTARVEWVSSDVAPIKGVMGRWLRPGVTHAKICHANAGDVIGVNR